MRQLAADMRELLKLHHFGGKLQLLRLLAAETAAQINATRSGGWWVGLDHAYTLTRACTQCDCGCERERARAGGFGLTTASAG